MSNQNKNNEIVNENGLTRKQVFLIFKRECRRHDNKPIDERQKEFWKHHINPITGFVHSNDNVYSSRTSSVNGIGASSSGAVW